MEYMTYRIFIDFSKIPRFIEGLRFAAVDIDQAYRLQFSKRQYLLSKLVKTSEEKKLMNLYYWNHSVIVILSLYIFE